jgi:glycosyltransferase involved in cell wall biosynthesis
MNPYGQRMKISYSLNRRPSQSRAAAAFQEIIAEHHTLTANQDEADVVIVHHPPWHYHTSYAVHPKLSSKYVVAVCNAHAEQVPELWRRNLGLVQEVWTCSDFSRRVLSQYHSHVFSLPYVVRRKFTTSSSADRNVRSLVDYSPDNIYLLAIGPVSEPRKAIAELVAAFADVADQLANARLIIKATPLCVATWENHKQVQMIPFQMPDDHIDPLYRIASAVISTHHAEAWGLPLSDAMLAGVPVIATGYSGNLEYMNSDNSRLLAWTSSRVRKGENGVSVEPDMEWATADRGDISASIVELCQSLGSNTLQQKVKRAQEDVARFTMERAEHFILNRLRQLGSSGIEERQRYA